MNLYLSGPMTGLPEYNTPAFDEAATEFRAMGHEVFNPAEADKEGPRMEWGEYMRRDLPLLLAGEFDALILLPGWWWSKGAFLEAQTAWSVDIPLVDMETRRRVKLHKHGNFLVQEWGDEFSLE